MSPNLPLPRPPLHARIPLLRKHAGTRVRVPTIPFDLDGAPKHDRAQHPARLHVLAAARGRCRGPLQRDVAPAAAADGVVAERRGLRGPDAVEGEAEGVPGVGFYGGCAVWGAVVEGGRGAVGGDEGDVVGRASCDGDVAGSGGDVSRRRGWGGRDSKISERKFARREKQQTSPQTKDGVVTQGYQ